MTVKRRFDYDLMRVLSMFGVVYLHTAAGALRHPENAAVWHFSNLITALATTAVPLFFMLSGALLLSRPETADPGVVLKKRLPKILLPLLAWSGLIILLTARGDPAGAASLLGNLLHNPVVVPYWFLYALVPMYLLAPLLKEMADGLTPVLWRYLLGLWFVLVLGLRTLRAFLPEGIWRTALTEHGSFNLIFVGGYLGYFLLGAALERMEHLPSRRTLWAAAGILYILIAAGTAWRTYSSGVYDETFKSYLNPFAALFSVVLFLLARSYLSQRESGRVLTYFSGISFGVYLAHPKAINLMQHLWYVLLHDTVDTIPDQVLLYLAILAGCVVGVSIAASIPVVCYLLTGQRFSAARRESSLLALFRPAQNRNN